jgi:hypothetical protein
MPNVSKTRRERSNLRPRDRRLIWMAAAATTIIALVELFYGIAASTQ